MIEAIFFDLYGTLAGFKPSRYEVQSNACSYFGIHLTVEGVIKGYGMADAYMSHENTIAPIRLKNPKEKDDFFAEYERLVLLGDDVKVDSYKALEIWRKIQNIPHDIVLFDEVKHCLKLLKSKDYTLGLISNYNKRGSLLLEQFGLTGILDFAVTSLDVGFEKPNKIIFEHAITMADTLASNVIYVGDQIESDVMGAINVGINPILIDRDQINTKWSKCPVINDIDQLDGVIEKTFTISD